MDGFYARGQAGEVSDLVLGEREPVRGGEGAFSEEVYKSYEAVG